MLYNSCSCDCFAVTFVAGRCRLAALLIPSKLLLGARFLLAVTAGRISAEEDEAADDDDDDDDDADDDGASGNPVEDDNIGNCVMNTKTKSQMNMAAFLRRCGCCYHHSPHLTAVGLRNGLSEH